MKYPEPFDVVDKEILKEFELIIEAIVSLRRCKTLVNKGNQRINRGYLKLSGSPNIEMMKPFVEKLAKVDEVVFVDNKVKNSVTDVSDNLESFISTDDIDVEGIIKKLSRQKEKLQRDIEKLERMLGNKKFIEKAPEKIVNDNRKALEDALRKIKKIDGEIKSHTMTNLPGIAILLSCLRLLKRWAL